MRTALLVLCSALSSAGAPATTPVAKCCFANTAYSGVCKVAPGKGESCDSILAYLNAPNTTGKSYCGGSSIRGGWKQVSCTPKAPEGGAAPTP